MTAPMSIADQIAAMNRDWPPFRLRSSTADSVTWVGSLQPNHGKFFVQIAYSLPMDFPQVRVLRPRLIERPDFEDGPLPHVYWPDNRPILCLFDPLQDEWDSGMAISKTTVPWTIDWLFFYELWSMTGKWSGGGRHPGQPIPQKARALTNGVTR